MERILDWFLDKVIPFVGSLALVVFVAEIAVIIIASLWKVIQWII